MPQKIAVNYLLFFLHMLIFLPSLFCDPLPQKVIICGVCKNVANPLPYTMRIMEKIGDLFSDYAIVVYENNSTDLTPNLLHKWSQRNPKVHFLSEHLSHEDLMKHCVNRIGINGFYLSETISRARNIVLDLIEAPQYDAYDYLIWMDMDFTCEPNYSGIVEVFESKQEWDAVFAYGIDPDNIYWDLYAFRDNRLPLGSESLGNAWWYEIDKNLKLEPSDSWYPVYSAFSGCGIYKRAAIAGCRYSGIVNAELAEWIHTILADPAYKANPLIKKYWRDSSHLSRIIHISNPHSELPEITNNHVSIILGDDPYQNIWRMSSFVYRYPSVCEHVPFHAGMINRGHNKLFINPRLIFRYMGIERALSEKTYPIPEL